MNVPLQGGHVTLPRAAGMSSNYEKLEEVGGTPARPGAYDPHPAPPSSPPPVVAAAASPAVAVAPGQQQIPTAAAAPQGAVPTAFAMPAGAHGVPVHAQLHAASAGMYPVVMPDLPDAVEVRTRPSFDHRRALTFQTISSASFSRGSPSPPNDASISPDVHLPHPSLSHTGVERTPRFDAVVPVILRRPHRHLVHLRPPLLHLPPIRSHGHDRRVHAPQRAVPGAR